MLFAWYFVMLWNLVFLRTAIFVILMAGSYWDLYLWNVSPVPANDTLYRHVPEESSLFVIDDVSAQENENV